MQPAYKLQYSHPGEPNCPYICFIKKECVQLYVCVFGGCENRREILFLAREHCLTTEKALVVPPSASPGVGGGPPSSVPMVTPPKDPRS